MRNLNILKNIPKWYNEGKDKYLLEQKPLIENNLKGQYTVVDIPRTKKVLKSADNNPKNDGVLEERMTSEIYPKTPGVLTSTPFGNGEPSIVSNTPKKRSATINIVDAVDMGEGINASDNTPYTPNLNSDVPESKGLTLGEKSLGLSTITGIMGVVNNLRGAQAIEDMPIAQSIYPAAPRHIRAYVPENKWAQLRNASVEQAKSTGNAIQNIAVRSGQGSIMGGVLSSKMSEQMNNIGKAGVEYYGNLDTLTSNILNNNGQYNSQLDVGNEAGLVQASQFNAGAQNSINYGAKLPAMSAAMQGVQDSIALPMETYINNEAIAAKGNEAITSAKLQGLYSAYANATTPSEKADIWKLIEVEMGNAQNNVNEYKTNIFSNKLIR